MKHHAIGLAALAFLALATLPLTAQDTLQDAEYYPLKVGTSWDYLVQGKMINVRVARHEKYNGVLCAVLESGVDGKVVATEHVSSGKDGVYRHSSGGFQSDPPTRILPSPFKKGEKWHVKSKVGPEVLDADYTTGEEEVTVPAGKFKAVTTKTSKFKSAGMDVEATIWYAKDVGMVKTVMSIGGNNVVLELSKFTPGKAP
jgi:hypothetical protein